jgi:hypothetical protein
MGVVEFSGLAVFGLHRFEFHPAAILRPIRGEGL